MYFVRLRFVAGIRGVATGGISVFIPPKSTQLNFIWSKNDVRTAIQQFYTPKKLLYPPKTNLWLRPWPERTDIRFFLMLI